MKKPRKKSKGPSNDLKVVIGSFIALAIFIPMWWFVNPTTKVTSLIDTISTYGIGFSGAGFVLALINYLFFKKSKLKTPKV